MNYNELNGITELDYIKHFGYSAIESQQIYDNAKLLSNIALVDISKSIKGILFLLDQYKIDKGKQ